jgi:prepilin signal peptidase PulO-like enzyme (type II secretory pathway)
MNSCKYCWGYYQSRNQGNTIDAALKNRHNVSNDMFIEAAIFLVLLGLAIGSFLNVCIDRLPPKRFLYMFNEKGDRLEIEISNKTFLEDPIELFKDKDIYVTGKLSRNPVSSLYHISVTQSSQLVLLGGGQGAENPVSLEEAKSKLDNTVTISGHISSSEVKRGSLLSPPSHCDNCGHKLGILDNIPIFSYLLLGGKCRYCKTRIPIRVLLVEFITAAIFFLAYWRMGLSAQYAISVFWSCIFILIIFIDWEQTLILNSITYPAAIIAIILLGLNQFVSGANIFGDRLFIPHGSLYSGLISAGVLFLFFILIVILTPGSMGMGDAKLVALIGLVSGFPLMIFSMIIGVVIGGVVAIVLLATRKKGRKDVIPYGTFLAIGPIVALLLPAGVMDWYLSFGH